MRAVAAITTRLSTGRPPADKQQHAIRHRSVRPVPGLQMSHVRRSGPAQADLRLRVRRAEEGAVVPAGRVRADVDRGVGRGCSHLRAN